MKTWRLTAALCCTLLLHWSTTASATEIRVSTFSCDVTPGKDDQPLIWTVPVTSVEDPLWAKGIVLDDGQSRCVLCAIDWCGLCNSSHRLFREKLAKAVGTDVARVAVHCVHQHTAPYVDGDAQRLLDKTERSIRYVDLKFIDAMSDRVAAAAKESLARLEPVNRVGMGQAKVDRVAATRRAFGPDGKIRVRYSSTKSEELRGLPEGDIDPLVRTITLAQDDTPKVRLHYYATHPQTYYGDGRVSADVPGIAREKLQEKEKVFQIYFTGCGGDVTMGKYNRGTPEDRAELASRLFAGMEASAAATKYAPIGRMEWRSLPVVLPLGDDAEQTVAASRKELANVEAKELARVLAATRVSFVERHQEPLELGLLRIGPAAILHLPGESMLEFQKHAQSRSRKGFLAVAAYGDLGTGYICTEKSFDEGGYEPTASRVSPKAEGVLKKAIDQILLPMPAKD